MLIELLQESVHKDYLRGDNASNTEDKSIAGLRIRALVSWKINALLAASRCREPGQINGGGIDLVIITSYARRHC